MQQGKREPVRLHLKPILNEKRRVGLTRDIITAPLHRYINDPRKRLHETMPAKPATKPAGRSAKEVAKAMLDEEEDINRLPDSSSDSDDGRPPPDIQKTVFGASKEKTRIAGLSKKQDKPTLNSRSLRDDKGAYKGTARPSPRASRGPSPSSSASTVGSSKRKSPITTKKGAGIEMDEFKQINHKKARQTYGSSQQKSSQQKTFSKKSSMCHHFTEMID